MRMITTAFSLLLSFVGCNATPTFTSDVRDSANGVERLHSQSRVRDGVGRFECRASLSGRCHYAVYDDRCVKQAGRDPAACHSAPAQIFSVAVGDRIERRGLSDRPRVCVRGDHAPAPDECQAH